MFADDCLWMFSHVTLVSVERVPPRDQLVFGAVIRKVRGESYTSQEALAAKAGLHRTYVSLLERGRRTPTLTIVLRLAKALGTSAAELVARFEAERQLPAN